jgi:RHS repeat-associated protein
LTQYPQLVPFNPQATPLDTQVTYTAQGHTAQETNSQSQKSYNYNAAERLTQYNSTLVNQTTASVEADYRYDPFGRRIAKTINEGGSAKTTYFIYSEGTLVGEADEQGHMVKAYGFNPIAVQGRLWSTDPVWQANVASSSLTDAGTTYYYLNTDAIETPMLAADRQGNVSWKATAESFGSTGILPDNNSITMNLRFQGQYFDEESGDHYNFMRSYDPRIGRYTQPDPIGLQGGWNLYAYVEGNPVSYTDPLGYVRQGGKTGQWWEYTDRNFQRWFHLCIKQSGDPDATRSELADAYAQWVQYGKPDGKNGCGGPPPPPIPTKTCDTCQKAATVVVVGGTAYLIYRCIRMIPSFNVAIP